MSRWTGIRDRAVRWLLEQIGYYDCPSAQGEGAATPAQPTEAGVSPAPVDAPPASPASLTYPLGLASCWGGSNASKRMMNILSPRMSDKTFEERLKFMLDRGCTHAHVILANGGDGEAAGYAAWRGGDCPKMLERMNAVRAAGLVPIPWIVTDDSASLLKELFANPAQRILDMDYAGFFAGAPLVVLGLEMDEGGSASQWKAVRDALRKHYSGPIGVHHTSGSSFPFASLGDVILGQLSPGCTTSQVKSQIKAILKLGKRAVGFEYARGPSRALSVAALEAGAEGVGNWDGGEVPANISAASAGSDNSVGEVDADAGSERPSGAGAPDAADAVDYSLLDWRWGRFDGRKAVRAAGAEIGSLKVTPNGLSYKWVSGGCEDLDRSCSHSKPCCTCALFCCVNGKWIGGKFDHISTDRRTRDFANIRESYGGWIPAALSRADAYAFVILDDGGKRRTNVITCGR